MFIFVLMVSLTEKIEDPAFCEEGKVGRQDEKVQIKENPPKGGFLNNGAEGET
ncbi:hypothetical protein [Photobacterium nomapromontoriensis]|uniref:hypothetical protein n=1 Tax=Photobacterium nomapromontoriensis TaxID=2910237 RepID=UPI003D14D664